jgi:hypothetical protein
VLWPRAVTWNRLRVYAERTRARRRF